MKIGKNLKQLREEKGLTLYKVCKDTNTSYPTLWQIENDKKTIGLELLVRLAKYYNVSLDWLCNM